MNHSKEAALKFLSFMCIVLIASVLFLGSIFDESTAREKKRDAFYEQYYMYGRDIPTLYDKVTIDSVAYVFCLDAIFTPKASSKPYRVPNPLHNVIAYEKEVAEFNKYARESYLLERAFRAYVASSSNTDSLRIRFPTILTGLYNYGDRSERHFGGISLSGSELGVPSILSSAVMSVIRIDARKHLPTSEYWDFWSVLKERLYIDNKREF